MSDETTASERELLWEIKTTNEQIEELRTKLAAAEARCDTVSHNAIAVNQEFINTCNERDTLRQQLTAAETETARLRRAMEAAASLAGRDWLIGQLALAESLQNVMGENLSYTLDQYERAKEGGGL